MNIKVLKQRLIRLKKDRGWSWEEMAMEFSQALKKRGPVTTTLYRFCTIEGGRPQPLVVGYFEEALERVRGEE